MPSTGSLPFYPVLGTGILFLDGTLGPNLRNIPFPERERERVSVCVCIHIHMCGVGRRESGRMEKEVNAPTTEQTVDYTCAVYR